MENLIHFDTVSEYNKFHGNETFHPLVSVVDYQLSEPKRLYSVKLGLYAVILKEIKYGEIRYGRSFYDYQEGTLLFLAPGQIVHFECTDELYEPKGFALIFHPDILRGTNLGRTINEYTFFNYSVNEALHISESERFMVLDLFSKIQFELKHAIDRHSRMLIISNIELFLNYCIRFYDRQFITRELPNKGVLEKFEELLNGFYAEGKGYEVGLPSVAYCAERLHLSPNYFGDLVKKATGQTAQEFILSKIVDVAKEKIVDIEKSIKEISYEMGFKYPQHFIRLFKKRVGQTPDEYRHMN